MVIAAMSLGVACVSFGTAREDPLAAGTDASAMLVEAAVPPDAGPAPPPEGGERLCATKHDLCDDFDGAQFLPLASWTRVVSPMFLSRDDLVAKSAPSSLFVTVDDSVRFGYAERDFTLPANTKGIACAVALNNGNGIDGVRRDLLRGAGNERQRCPGHDEDVSGHRTERFDSRLGHWRWHLERGVAPEDRAS